MKMLVAQPRLMALQNSNISEVRADDAVFRWRVCGVTGLSRSFYSLFALTLFEYGLLSSSYVLPSQFLRMNFSAWQMGVLMSVFYIGAFAARPASGWLVEKLGIRRCIFGASAVGVLFGAAMLSGSFSVLFAARAGLGVCESVLYVAIMAYQGLAITEEERGRVMGLLTLASMIPQFVLMPLSEFLIDGGHAWLFMLLPSLILGGAALFSFSIPDGVERSAKKADENWGTWGELLSRRDTWALCASFFMVTLTATAACQYIPTLMRGLGLHGTPYTWSLALVSIAIRLTICARVMTSFDRRASFSLMAVVESVSLLLGAGAGGMTGFIASGVLFGIGHGLDYPAISALLPDVVPPHLMPKGASLFLLIHDLPPILVPLLIGAVPAAVGLGGVIFATGVLGAAAFPLIYVFLWRPGMSKKNEARA